MVVFRPAEPAGTTMCWQQKQTQSETRSLHPRTQQHAGRTQQRRVLPSAQLQRQHADLLLQRDVLLLQRGDVLLQRRVLVLQVEDVPLLALLGPRRALRSTPCAILYYEAPTSQQLCLMPSQGSGEALRKILCTQDSRNPTSQVAKCCTT